MNQVQKKLKKVCTKCSAASIHVYWNNVKRLYAYYGDGEVTGESWLHSKKVKAGYNKEKLGTRRHLSTAAAKMTVAFKSKNDYWPKQMKKDSEAYSEKRKTNEKSPTETKKWLKGGFKSLKKGSAELWRKTKRLLENEDKPSLKTLYKYQQYILLKLYSQIPLRNTYASFTLGSKGNYIKNPYKGTMSFIITQHKSAKHTGDATIKPSRSIAIALRKFLNYRKKLIETDHVFSNVSGEKMTKGALGKLLHRITRDVLGKAVGSRLIRVMAVSEKKDAIDEVNTLANNMLHTTSTQKSYVRV